MALVVPSAALGAMLRSTPALAAVTCTASTFSAGFSDSAAIVNGQLLVWGRNYDGELGIGHRGDLTGTPTPISTSNGLGQVQLVWTGFETGFAVDTSGELWGWGGFDSFGERGNSGGGLSPAPVVGPVNVVSLGPADAHTIAVTADGTVWGWGDPSELGLPGFFPVTPMPIPAPAGVIKVAAGEPYSLVLTADHTLYATGGNDKGQLGLGSGVTRAEGFQAVGVPGVVDMAAGDSVGSQFTLAVDGSGHVFAFGSNFYGQMGSTPSTAYQYTPVQVPGIDSVTQVAAGDGHALALKSDHTVWAWGNNAQGELGIGSTTLTPTPTQVTFPAGVQIVAIAAGGEHSLALDAAGHLWSWGHNGTGEIGNGFIFGLPVLTPVQVNIGTVNSPCSGSARYLPSVNGYAFPNDGTNSTPTYDQMASFYPSSRNEMYIPFTKFGTPVGSLFYHTAFLNFYSDGVCYGMAASDQYLYNEFPSKSVHDDFTSFASKFTDKWGPSPSPQDVQIQDFIERYHSRQLAASGALEAGIIWNQTEDAGGNSPALNAIAAVTDTGKTEWVGLGPARYLLGQGLAGKQRFWQLFNESHAVLAYDVDKANGTVKIYDPNAPGDDGATLQVVSSGRPGGGVKLVHGDGTTTFGGGIKGSNDFGQPDEWTMMPLAEPAFSDAGIVPGQDNLHWVLDAGALALIHKARPSTLNGVPLFKFVGPSALDSTATQMLAAGTGFSDTTTADDTGSDITVIAGPHGAQATQTDAAAAGSSHATAISSDASDVTLSNASAAEQFTILLAGDFLAGGYGRQMTINEATLAPGSTLEMSADPTYSSLALSASTGPDQAAGLLLEQRSAAGASVNVTATIPGGGGQGVVYVGDWTGLQSSLVFEVITAADGSVRGILLQDNPAQRQALESSLIAAMSSQVAQIADGGVRASLQAKLDNAGRLAASDPVAASNLLQALRNEIAAQTGKAISSSLAGAIDASARETIGLLRATVG